MLKEIQLSRNLESAIQYTTPKFKSSPLKNGGWKMSFLLGLPIFRGELLNFRGVSQDSNFVATAGGSSHDL